MPIITLNTSDLSQNRKIGTLMYLKYKHRSRPTVQGGTWTEESIGTDDSFVLIFKKEINGKKEVVFRLKAGGTDAGAYEMAESTGCDIDFTDNTYSFTIPVSATEKLATISYKYDVEWFEDDLAANKKEIFSNQIFRLYD